MSDAVKYIDRTRDYYLSQGYEKPYHPCHRVIGADGSLTGFGGGIETKRFLLELEHSRSGLFAASSS